MQIFKPDEKQNLIMAKKKGNFLGKSKLSREKQKILGTFVILAFVAFAAITLTRYFVAYNVSLSTTAIISLSLSLALILIMEFRKGTKKTGKKKRKSKKKNR